MGDEGRRTVRGPQAGREPTCPACRRPVGTVIRRHKVLGAWVPRWEPLPCTHADCALFGRTPGEAEDVRRAERRRKRRGRADGRASGNEPGNSTKIG
ncbi:hypothetical protein BJP40_29610 [Streptomyces sp. CC53]|uniref:hypothetical protein n=1 Tax=unclassified Streptomyces TaxID=2593676 RepID=UPI0008DDE986|nr:MULTISPECIES: hypothetical protein [unclassified Streptomyces]OII62078.1 hypothetical protein BJP40_29610 [Streptomyces sp. CC53]OII66885.1 hypothetical protein BJP39_07760 [Streptomyces sp. CC77]